MCWVQGETRLVGGYDVKLWSIQSGSRRPQRPGQPAHRFSGHKGHPGPLSLSGNRSLRSSGGHPGGER